MINEDKVSLIIFFSFLLITLLRFFYYKIKKDKKNIYLYCPVRGLLKSKKYDSKYDYSEEYYRICLIKYLLKKGYVKKQFFIEFVIRIGHKGRNSLRVDLVIKKVNKVLIVAEIKKKYSKAHKYSAIKHQLIPAMKILNSPCGIYFDGSDQSCILFQSNNGKISIEPFKMIF